MRLLKKISVIILLGMPLFFSEGMFAQAINAKPQQSNNTLQEVNELFIKGVSTSDKQLTQQAKIKISQWLKENDQTAAKNILAQALRTRASMSLILNETNEAITDFKTANQYEPMAEVQLGICFLEKEQAVAPSDLQKCYAQTVQMFTDKQTSETDINYLLARILSGDKTAIAEYKLQIEQAEENEKFIYKMAAKKYLEKSTCEQITTNYIKN